MSDTYSVSYITNTMRGAPVIQGNAPGGLIAVLDCLLINGWGLAAPQSLTVAAGVATATFASATAWDVGAVIEVTGASPAGLNGKWRVATSSGNTMTFATTAADGTYTGTMGIKYAGAGWEKVFSGTNKAVYRSTDPTGSRFYLRVDDSNGMTSVVTGYESMSDIDTGTGRYPTADQVPAGGYWAKAQAYNGVSIPYVFAADARMLLHAIAWGVASSTDSTACEVRGFGEPIAVSPTGDAYACVLSCRATVANQYGESMPGALSGSTSDSGISNGMCVAPRSWQGLGTAVLQRPFPLTGVLNALSGTPDYLGAAPSLIDGQIKTSIMALKDQAAGSPLRSIIPGVYYIPQSGVLTLFSNFAIADGAGELAGRRLIAVHVGNATYQRAGVALIDLRGPWR